MLEGSRARAVSAYEVNEEGKLSSFPLILRAGKYIILTISLQIHAK